MTTYTVLKFIGFVAWLLFTVWVCRHKRCWIIGHDWNPVASGEKLCVDKKSKEHWKLVEMKFHRCQRSGCSGVKRVRKRTM